ncbi:MAG TPA: ArsA family ATPase [Mycobacteriales bacterium]|nr:ArsA family ATPase [Mycobacteriales bacterium]
MRLVLFTGKGGVGKTTAAAATGALLAARGRKALVVSTDPAHSLADALGEPLGPTPTEVGSGLAGMQVDAQRRFEAGWGGVRDWLGGLLQGAGLDAVTAGELPVPPGAADVCALLEVRDQLAAGPWDAVLVDCAPTAETLRLLALPEALAGYLERVWPAHRRMLRSLGPALGRLGGLAGEAALPPAPALAALDRLQADLTDVRALLTAPGRASVRLVLTPEAVVVAEARRTLTALALHGYAVDSVLANRVFPAEADGSPWGAAWRAAQGAALAGLVESVPGLPVRTATYRMVEPVGVPALRAVGEELYGADDPLAPAPAAAAPAVSRDGDDYVLRVPLPFVRRSDVQLLRAGDELVLTVGGQRRRLALPSVLRRCVAVGAAAGDGAVRVRFRPDPELWPRALAVPGRAP